jgi:hypothetical protein
LPHLRIVKLVLGCSVLQPGHLCNPVELLLIAIIFPLAVLVQVKQQFLQESYLVFRLVFHLRSAWLLAVCRSWFISCIRK